MIWIGVFVGVLLGFAFESFPWGLVFTVIGLVAGLIINSHRQKQQLLVTMLQKRVSELQARLTQSDSAIRSLEQRLEGEGKLPMTPQIVEPVVQAKAAPSTPTANVEATKSPTAQIPLPSPIVAAAVAPFAKASIPVAQATPMKAAPTAPPRPPKPSAPPSALELLIRRWIFGGNPIVKIGVLILFLGLAFLLRYASEYIVVPVELRYAGVAATGVALLLFGWRLRHKQDNYGLILQGAGIAVMYLTPLAAMRLNGLLPPEFGFAVLVAVALFAAILAILQDSLAMAMAGTLGGFAAPVLVSTGHDAHLALFLFLLVLNLGITTIAWFKAWRVLNLIGFAGTFTLGLGWANKFYRPALFSETEPFLLLFFAMYVLITFLFARRVLAEAKIAESDQFGAQIRESASHLNYVDGVLVFGVPCAAFSMQYVLANAFTNGPAFSALGFGLFYAALALLLFRQSGMRTLLLTETLIALAVIFGSLAIPLGLDQTWTSAAWAIEAAGVYWIGIRQQRLHGRIFALVVLLLAAVRSLAAIKLDTEPTVIEGSALGCLLLAGSAAWIAWLIRSRDQWVHANEKAVRPWIISLGVLFLALTPFSLLRMQWASPALAVMGVVMLFFALRWSERLLQSFAWLYQALAGALFLSTLHLADSGSALTHGVTGLFTVSLIGASMLASFWLFTRQRSVTAGAALAQAASFSLMATVGLLAGIVFINVAPLFVLPWHYAAMIWPLSGVLTLWWAVRIRHLAAIVMALILQVIAGLVYVGDRVFEFDFVPTPPIPDPKPFMHSGFLGPILISLAAFVCARLLHAAATRLADTKPTAADAQLGGIALLWSVAWWSFGWTDELYRVVPPQLLTASLLALTIITGLIWSALARRWRWQALGLTTLLYLPALILIAGHAFLFSDSHPLSSWGMLAWPVALLMHGYLLRQQSAWISATGATVQLTNVVGVWLFVIQAALELRWRFAHLGDADSAWPLLGWMIAPVAYLLLLTRPRIQQAWPVREQRDAYLVSSALPVVIYLIGWVWISNAISPGNASPLPYVPFINPLEIAHFAVLFGVFLWFWPLREHPSLRAGSTAFISITMATGLAMLTGIVARTCHHWGGVAWNSDDMLASQLFQTSLSVVWSIVAITTMLIGNRRKQRWVWIVGAALIAVVVVKLFLVELAAHGSLARIVSFIVVGLLLLVVGYFAPLPPRPVIEKPSGKTSAESDMPT